MEFKHRVGFSIGGGIVGLLGSYFFRPISEMSGRGPSLGAWKRKDGLMDMPELCLLVLLSLDV